MFMDKNPSQQTKAMWFQISGIIGTVIFFFFDKAVFALNPIEWKRVTVSWTISYACSIVWQHALHSQLVFGWKGSYVKSLISTYAAYSLSIALSSVVNDLLVSWVGLGQQAAWVVTLMATGVINFFTVGAAFDNAGAGKGKGQGKSGDDIGMKEL